MEPPEPASGPVISADGSQSLSPSERWVSQTGFRIRFDWGREGVARAVGRGNVVIVVDALRFSTSVAVAVQRGALVYPCGWGEDASALAALLGGTPAAARPAAGDIAAYPLSPSSFERARRGQRIVLASPNGAVCSQYGATAAALYAAAFVNAQATATAASRCAGMCDVAITVVACGERWPDPAADGALRFAVEDYLGAGAIVHHLDGSKSPESRACEASFVHLADDLPAVLENSSSGRELIEKGWGEDVAFASRLNACSVAAVLKDGWFQGDTGSASPR